MPKKVKKAAGKSKNYALKLTILIFGVFVFTVGLTIFFNLKSQHVCANSISCINDLSGNKTADTQGVYLGKAVNTPNEPSTDAFAIANARQAVLGDTTDTKHIYVDLSQQRLYAYQGNSLFMNVPIASGLYNPTPTGDFKIWVWLRYTRMTGGSGADYYNLPNVPYVMYFYNDSVLKQWGYSLHGEYWYPYSGLGTPRSHGCVNMSIPDAQKLYYWSNPSITGSVTYPTADYQGPTITIYGKTP